MKTIQTESYKYPIFNCHFMKFEFRISGRHKIFKILVEELRTLALMVRVQLLFNSDILKFVWKTDEGKVESIVLLILVLWRCFNCLRGGGVGQYVLFRAS